MFIHEHIYTCINMHTPIHFTLHTRTHYYIAMHTLHVKKSHSDCSQSLIKNHPNRLLCCLLLLYHVFVHFVYYFMQFRTRKSAVICRRSARNYRNKPYIAKKRYCCLLSGKHNNNRLSLISLSSKHYQHRLNERLMVESYTDGIKWYIT